MSKPEEILTALQSLNPEHLELLDESHTHAKGYESHYKVIIVSTLFQGLNSLKRHQQVYAAMGPLMQRIHALAIHTYTPDEWSTQGVAPLSPVCAGSH